MHADYIEFMCFVWLSDKTVTFALYIIKTLDFITEMESVYSAVRTEYLYNTDMSGTWRVNDYDQMRQKFQLGYIQIQYI
jgi:hypothetical protein